MSYSEIWNLEWRTYCPDYNPRHVFSVPWSSPNVVYRSFLRGRHWPGCRNCLRVSMAALEEEILDKLKGRDLGLFPASQLPHLLRFQY